MSDIFYLARFLLAAISRDESTGAPYTGPGEVHEPEFASTIYVRKFLQKLI